MKAQQMSITHINSDVDLLTFQANGKRYVIHLEEINKIIDVEVIKLHNERFEDFGDDYKIFDSRFLTEDDYIYYIFENKNLWIEDDDEE